MEMRMEEDEMKDWKVALESFIFFMIRFGLDSWNKFPLGTSHSVVSVSTAHHHRISSAFISSQNRSFPEHFFSVSISGGAPPPPFQEPSLSVSLRERYYQIK